MDHALSSEERKELCNLLGIARHCYGNYPLMKSNFKHACLKYHPDKGGDQEKMARLNFLWQKFLSYFMEMRRNIPEEDEEPIYGTTAFRHWWYRQHSRSHGRTQASTSGTSSRSSGYGSQPSQSSSTGSQDGFQQRQQHGESGDPDHSFDSEQQHNQHQSTDSEQQHQQQNSKKQKQQSKKSHHSSSSSSSRSDIPSSHGSHGFSGGNIYGNSSRVPPWDDDSLLCEESLSSSPSPEPAPTSTEEEPSFSESSSFRGPPGTPSQSTDDDFSMPRSPPKRRRAPSPPSSYSSTPPRPKKNKPTSVPTDFPDDLLDCLSHAVYSNKTMSAFAIFTTQEKGKFFYEKLSEKFKVEYKGRFGCKEGCILVIVTLTKHRVSAVKNFALPFCTVSFLLIKGINKLMEMYDLLQSEPYRLIEENKSLSAHEFTEKKEITCNWNLVADFAHEHGIDDPLLILAHYLDFAKPYPCNKCSSKSALKPHKSHEQHHKNAKLFIESKSQKSICLQAAETVQAKRRLLMLELTREEMLCEKFKSILEKLKDLDPPDLKIYMAGVAWYYCLFDNFPQKVLKILKLLTENIPKKRNVLFKGPINSGKTSLAAAFLDLLDGKALNVNCPADKLPFELGCALDKFCVCFEDVKGQLGANKDLQPGQGFHNLDNLRDHLDGAVPVSLEKKHINKRHQIFPPCIITANEYAIPVTVAARIAYTLNFSLQPNLKASLDKNHDLRKMRVLQSGTTLLLCLIWHLDIEDFKSTLHDDVQTWKDILRAEVGRGMYYNMVENVEKGENPLFGIVDEEEEEEEPTNE
ncbi:large T-antigen [bat polyomavirus 2c]|uniref:DNA 3'-5' helicase n=1 Tax=bat polyomavirus 2c TaxID=2758133 RepID=J7HD82_9POLY|nr:large T-antigen [Betapolyomavirus arplanirostris]AFP94187.1 large T-antigen [bat polyomavirus 2c]